MTKLQHLLQHLHHLSSLVTPTSPLHTTSTHLPTKSLLHSAIPTRHSLYELEPLLSAASIFFCRFVTKTGSLTGGCSTNYFMGYSNKVEFVYRTLMAVVLGGMTYVGMPYEWICSVELWSHVLPWLIGRLYGCNNSHGGDDQVQVNKRQEEKPPSLLSSMAMAFILTTIYPICLFICRFLSSPYFYTLLPTILPMKLKHILGYMLPLSEMKASYDIISVFYTDDNPHNTALNTSAHEMLSQKKILHDMLRHLLFVTTHTQFGLGYIGIDFLRREQERKNMLIRMDLENNDDCDDNNNSSGKVKEKHDTSSSSSSSKHNNENAKHNGNSSKANTVKTNKKKSSSDPSRKFRNSAPTFILFTVLPYMFQIILFGNMNNFAFMYVRDQIHHTVRIDELFRHDSHLEALASDSATSPGAYASSMDKVVSTAYDILNRKLFSLPKLLLLPGVISRKPALLIRIFPFIFLTDILKGRMVASITSKVEEFQKEAQDLNSIRQKVEQYDMKNAELLRRSGTGSIQFTRKRWTALTMEHQAKMAAGDLLSRTRSFFMWLQRNFVFVALIDCALAELLAGHEIVVAEIFVFSRAIEDVVDLLLIRSRSESELATLLTQVDKLKGLESVWSRSKEPNVLPCRIEPDSSSTSIALKNLGYSRGSAEIMIDHLTIEKGIYAVTGANGSGKSTLFRLIMACETNERPVDLHESIVLETPVHSWDLSDNLVIPDNSCKVPDEDCKIEEKENSEVAIEVPVTSIIMPSSDVVEISQVFYWPLYTTPIDWMYQQYHHSELNEAERGAFALRIAKELQSLSFSQSQTQNKFDNADNGEDAIETLTKTLQEEREDWFSELSGGQKSKVELVRKVFLRDSCPSVLLIDETMAPLDPSSKSQVMERLKQFCSESIVLVIYHTDVGRGKDTTNDSNSAASELREECVPSNGFFDHNLHVVNGKMIHRSVC